MAINYYDQSTWGSGAAYITRIELGLTATGWTLVDAISSTHRVWRSPDLIAGSGCSFFLEMQYVGSLGLEVGVDYDTSTHTLLLPSGSAGGGGSMFTPGGPAYFYCNQYGFYLFVNDGVTNDHTWVGQPRTRQLQGVTDGLAVTTAPMSAAATTVNISVDLTGRLYVGQVVAIQNFAHNSASGNASNTELVTITAVGAGTLSFTATSNAYDSGAKIGPPDMLWPLGGSNAVYGAYSNGTIAISHQAVGFRASPASNTGQSALLNAGMVTDSSNVFASLQASYALGTAIDAFVPTLINSQTAAAGMGQPIFGVLSVGLPTSGTHPSAGTKYTDGVNVFIQPAAASSAGPTLLVGPTGDTPDFSTMVRILPPTIAVSDTFYTFVPAVGGAPTNALNQGLN